MDEEGDVTSVVDDEVGGLEEGLTDRGFVFDSLIFLFLHSK